MAHGNFNSNSGTTGQVDRSLPNSEDSERVILGAIVQDNTLLTQVKGLLEPSDCYSLVNRRILAAIFALDEQQKPIEPGLLLEEINKDFPEGVVNLTFLTQLAIGVPVFSDLSEYVRIVREKSIRRKAIKVADVLKARLMADDEPLERVLKTGRRLAESFFVQAGGPKSAETNVLRVKSANEWIDEAKNRPIPKKLFGELIFQDEVTIMFGPTGKGKSCLAVQIGESVASGCAIAGFELGLKAVKCLYFDCELSDKQFEGRYASKLPDTDYYFNHFQFSDNLLRAEIDISIADLESPGEFQDALHQSLAEKIREHDIKFLIVDNISWLRDETEKARAALPLMKALVALKRRLNVTILVLAHTPKRDLSQPITLNHLQGSAVLANFADSIFAIGESVKDPGIRYIKQLKVRSAELLYGAENVKLAELVKKENFLRFEFHDEEVSESEHLKQISEYDLVDRYNEIAELHRAGKSQREIAKAVNLSTSTVNKYVKRIEAAGPANESPSIDENNG